MANLQPINNNDDNDEEQILQQVMKASMDTYAFEQTTYIDNAIYEDAPEQELDTILQQIKTLHNIQTPIPIPINNNINNNINDDNEDNEDEDNEDEDNEDDDMFEILENIRLLEELEKTQAQIHANTKLQATLASNRIMKEEQDAEYYNALLIDKQKEQEKIQEHTYNKANSHIHIAIPLSISIINDINEDINKDINNNNKDAENIDDIDDIVIPLTKEQMRQARLNRFNK